MIERERDAVLWSISQYLCARCIRASRQVNPPHRHTHIPPFHLPKQHPPTWRVLLHQRNEVRAVSAQRGHQLPASCRGRRPRTPLRPVRSAGNVHTYQASQHLWLDPTQSHVEVQLPGSFLQAPAHLLVLLLLVLFVLLVLWYMLLPLLLLLLLLRPCTWSC